MAISHEPLAERPGHSAFDTRGRPKSYLVKIGFAYTHKCAIPQTKIPHDAHI